MKGYVYILKSMSCGQYYVGSTTDIKTRLYFHNSGRVIATKNKRPYELMFFQEFESIKVAKRIETKIKVWKRKDFIEKILNDGEVKNVDA